MNLYEHEGKDFFSSHGIAVPRGVVIERNDDARAAYTALGCPEVMVKAQVLSGKRGKHGGVHHARNAHDAAQAAKDFFSSPINGQYVASVLIEERIDSIAEEYVSVTYDTQQAQPIFLHSTQGGMDIEDVPEQHIHRTVLDIRHENIDVPHSLAQLLWDCFRTSDARLVEINPLMKTIDGRFVAADAKVALDDDRARKRGRSD
jgi:succinyl-CoA synthetase beta subunit